MKTHTTRIAVGLATALLLGIASACGSSAKNGVTGTTTTGSSNTIVGAGSTFVAPLLTQWQGDYSTRTGATVTYGAIGSGGGIAQVTSRTVDFGASDAPLTPDQFKACNSCVQIPWALGGTAFFYNLPGVKGTLHIDGPTLARIYLGEIKNWNDPALARLNPSAHLPSTRISVVHRSDGSGTTFNVADYFATVSAAWKSSVGTGTSVNWPTGTGETHSSGVAAAVVATPGAIGYAEAAYAVSNHLNYFSVKNAAGEFVAPTTAAIAAAATTAEFRGNNSASIVDPPASAAKAYPVSTFTYVIVPRSSGKLAALKKFIDYASTDGQTFAAALDFAPLPKSVVAKAKAIVRGL